ncbi:beta-glucosidase [Arthrobacter sp. RAF14]|uniref:beta-glucosidase family protein n=1 Tax=Arthrobacter sp. RAF14 TaxID=3233051 RepID=UPI003F935EB3
MTQSTSTDAQSREAVAQAISRLSLEEKVNLLTGETAFTLPGNDAIGLVPLAFSDGPTGVRGLKFMGGDAVALFPNATLIASSWDDAIAEEVGGMLSEEAHRQNIHVVLGPTINLHRTPLGGRLFEAYSEDPYLTGRAASAYVRGLQEGAPDAGSGGAGQRDGGPGSGGSGRRGGGTGACLKHLVANESEILRNFMDSRVSETALREVYLLPFEMAVQDAHPWAMMAAYNDINGVTATEQDHIQNGIVKDEWGWDGLIMSDWFATKRTVQSANGGLDLVMPGPVGPWGDRLVAAVRRGDVAESTVDDHVTRLLLLARRTGAFGTDGTSPLASSVFAQGMPAPDSPERREQLRRIATRGMTLLKNDAGALPLSQDGPVALVGRSAVHTVCMGGGSAQVTPPYQVSIAEGLETRLGDRLTVVDGLAIRRRPLAASPEFVTDPVSGEPGVRITRLAADGHELGSGHSPVASLSTGFDDPGQESPAAVRIEADLRNPAGTVRVGAIGAGHWHVTVTGPDGTVLEELDREVSTEGFDPGEGILRPPAFSELLDLPAGVRVTAAQTFRTVDWRAVLEAQPHVRVAEESHIFAASGAGVAALVAESLPVSDDQALAAAEEAAGGAGTAVVVVGLTEEDETEAADKHTLALPGRQDELVRRVAAAAERTVVVVNAATPILMPWLDEVDAVVIVGLPGQEGGHAVADVLTGAAEPTGRLVTTYPSADGAAPAWNTQPDETLGLDYSDGTAIGYRGYHAGNAPEPLFWFGAGLGFGAWEYADAELTDDDGAPAVSLTLRNVSARDSREAVQLYYDPAEAGQPVRLAGYATVEVPAGGSVPVTVRADPRLFRRWDETAGSWQDLSGGELLLARGLGDIRARVSLG